MKTEGRDVNQLNADSQSYKVAPPSPTPDERYVLSHSPGGGWSVYYADKGPSSVLREFNSEAEACLYLISLLSAEEQKHAA